MCPSNLALGRVLIWLAALATPFQIEAAAGCNCTSHAETHTCHTDTPRVACCHDRAMCCSSESRRASQASASGHTERVCSTAGHRCEASCCCGVSCRCSQQQLPAPSVPPVENESCAKHVLSHGLLAEGTLPSPVIHGQFTRPIVTRTALASTAQGRCISLCRFLL
jgi:hypothetical protein